MRDEVKKSKKKKIKNEDEVKDKKKTKEKKKEPGMLQIMALNKPEWHFIVLGCIGACFSGAVQPAFAIIFTKAIVVFSICDIDEQNRKIILYSCLFLLFGVVTFLSNVLMV